MWKNITVKQALYFALIIFIIYICVRPIVLRAKFKKNIKNVKCRNVWGFMADFRFVKLKAL